MMTTGASRPRRALNTARIAALAAVERRVPCWPAGRIERLQRHRLRQMVRHAYGTVPYYRETMDRLGLRPDDIATVADLARLPIVEREQLRRDPEYFLSSAQPRARYLQMLTGGSTGAGQLVYCDHRALLANAAHGERDRSVITGVVGRAIGYRETVLGVPFRPAHEFRRYLATQTLAPARVRVERQFLSVLDPPDCIARQIDAFAPDVIHGSGSTFELLLAHHQASGDPFPRPTVITFSSDALSDAARRAIEERHGIPVFGTYQAIEAFKIGFECERRDGYHLNLDLYPVRIVDADGRTLPLGEVGDVVVSNLVNRATVLLNYRLGDLAAMLPDPCPCGRSLPLLSALAGRSDDVIALPSGRVVPPQAVRAVFISEEQVWQYQLVQQAPTRFTVALVAAGEADRPRLRERVAAALAERLGDPVTIDVRFVDAIERTAGGKVRSIVSLSTKTQTGSVPTEASNGG